jgi:hypothetical protein
MTTAMIPERATHPANHARSFGPHRSLFSRFILFALPVLAGLALPGRPARANLIYTWNETDNQKVTGTLEVADAALNNGQITLNDVISFSFSVPATTYAKADLVAQAFVFPAITIDKMTGAFTSGVAASLQAVNAKNNDKLIVTVNAASMIKNGGGNWSDALNKPATGAGYWTVGIFVPEPSSLVLGGIAVACGIGQVLYCKRETRRKARTDVHDHLGRAE